ncbi:MAG: hypothetical protein EZS28_043174 [Streblomastix strix]|uniref:Uncharacterized protein n=1 Tax=Streblomastix strix TaxID=222440 RepID=A0A5J4TTG9_9EUKA|nr:MAG: hypothetical protein EZS28_043174 [Streblomastix strix]
MGFFSGLKNFGSKILTGIKKAASWVAPTLHKVMGTLSGPVSMLHPGAGQIMGTIGNIADTTSDDEGRHGRIVLICIISWQNSSCVGL